MAIDILLFLDRYIALKDGTLVYYKSQLETDFGCRGAISIDKATIKSHELDELRFDVSVSDCVWYLRAQSVEDRQKWIDALELAQKNSSINHSIGRYDSAMVRNSHRFSKVEQNSNYLFFFQSLTSSSSIRKSGHNLNEKLAEMETFKDILSQQIDKLGAYIEQCGKNGLVTQAGESAEEISEALRNSSPGNANDKVNPLDFKAEAITFKATANGILFSLANCIELLSRSEEHWRKRLEKEQAARKRAEERYRRAVSKFFY